MDLIRTTILSLLLIPVALLLGGLLNGIDRVLTAKLQSRKGPPLLQPFYDVLKLLAKEQRVVHPWLSFAPAATLSASAAALLMFLLQGDLLIILFVHAVSGVFLVLGAMISCSPYSQCGGQRELWQMLSCESLLFLLAGALYLTTGSFQVHAITTLQEPLFYRAPLLFFAFLFALTIKMRKSPFDLAGSHHAHQELVRGIYTDYAGPHLGLLELAHWLDLILYLAIGSLFWATHIPGMVLLSLASFLLIIALDNITARLTWRWLLSRGLPVAFLLSAANLLWIKG